ncbi:hypothetical protein B0T18DRAFT_2774 [Schizothecium vesticola]|uniref:Uncharacterized protein n=1 Tax=Schizothecium vesticola TaxID=314040 RepID=A0AA40F8S8_9PEZI|nr:hypothetical protein B0T18DRAFT_2774 [Schizothecium vesticola]
MMDAAPRLLGSLLKCNAIKRGGPRPPEAIARKLFKSSDSPKLLIRHNLYLRQFAAHGTHSSSLPVPTFIRCEPYQDADSSPTTRPRQPRLPHDTEASPLPYLNKTSSPRPTSAHRSPTRVPDDNIPLARLRRFNHITLRLNPPVAEIFLGFGRGDVHIARTWPWRPNPLIETPWMVA